MVGQSESAQGEEAFRWTESGGMIGIGDLPGGDFQSIAMDVSHNGRVIVGSGASEASFEEAFRWDEESGMVGLGFLPGEYQRSIATGVSADGEIVVGLSGIAQDDLAAFIWDNAHGMRSLQQVLAADPNLIGDLTGWRLAMAYDVSADGKAIVGRGYNPSATPRLGSSGWTSQLISQSRRQY